MLKCSRTALFCVVLDCHKGLWGRGRCNDRRDPCVCALSGRCSYCLVVRLIVDQQIISLVVFAGAGCLSLF